MIGGIVESSAERGGCRDRHVIGDTANCNRGKVKEELFQIENASVLSIGEELRSSFGVCCRKGEGDKFGQIVTGEELQSCLSLGAPEWSCRVDDTMTEKIP